MNIYEPGTTVLIGTPFPAYVLSAEIFPGGHVVYRCAWWNDNVLEDKYLPACMVKPNENTRSLKIGFGT
jgi:hypothetical protein